MSLEGDLYGRSLMNSRLVNQKIQKEINNVKSKQLLSNLSGKRKLGFSVFSTRGKEDGAVTIICYCKFCLFYYGKTFLDINDIFIDGNSRAFLVGIITVIVS